MASGQSTREGTAGKATAGKLHGMRVAILATDGFEEVELTKPRAALDAAGARTVVVAPHDGAIRAWNRTDWGAKVRVDCQVKDADPGEFDALLLPGGVMNPDQLRLDAAAVRLVRAFFEAEKPVAAICHAPVMLIEADVLRGGRHLTSWPSIATDIANAGGRWRDQEVVVDGLLLTSRKPDDIPAFNRAMVELFAAESPAMRSNELPEG